METLTVISAQLNDVHILSQMNKELIEDEKSDNPMTLEELNDRMTDFLNNDWKAVLLVLGEQAVGYALYQEREDINNRKNKTFYIRQYFIRRQYRRRGLGKQGIDKLRAELFQNSTLIIDVLESNPMGRRFWEEIGFNSYYTNMRLNP
ncbi:GNAT family N-acetyltransferase [Paenibacillus shunpengii]|uniref:GNAT family N-acetyltransferase n=1 Tax=Paenibacillus shunpengii TaxID=2054424 RepID=A0ABW5SII0_9BACL